MAATAADLNSTITGASPTAAAGTLGAYQAPPNFQGRADLVNGAFNAATTRLNAAQSTLYKNMGYQDGTTNLDTANQYGSIQQLLHQQGQDLMADDQAEAHRGFGMDSGLAGQRARLINYASHAQGDTLGKTWQSNMTDVGNQRVDASQTQLTGLQGVADDKATWDGQTNYNNWIASQLAATPVATPGSTSGSPSGVPLNGLGDPWVNPGARESLTQPAPQPTAKYTAAKTIKSQAARGFQGHA